MTASRIKLPAVTTPNFAFVIFLMIHVSALPAAAQNKKSLQAGDSLIRYEGRVALENNAAILYWSGTSVNLHCTGGALYAKLRDQRGHNYYNVVIDGKVSTVLQPDTTEKWYRLSWKLSRGDHAVQLFRRTDCGDGQTWFGGVRLRGHGKFLTPLSPHRSIEFYGNSITSGAAMYPDSSRYGHCNNYETYAAITARHFNASYTCISRSGIGLMISWFPMIMPEMYGRVDPFDSSSAWDFSRSTPDVVVINLLQNDCALFQLPDHKEFKRRFGNAAPDHAAIVHAYQNFLHTIRSRYPAANIVCVLGNMDAVKPGSPWPGYIREATDSLGDKKVFTNIFAYKNTPGHPNASEHREMAKSLIAFIESNIRW